MLGKKEELVIKIKLKKYEEKHSNIMKLNENASKYNKDFIGYNKVCDTKWPAK